MTLYTIVSLVIAISGSTFTAIVQFSNFVGERVDRLRRDSTDNLNVIVEQLVETGKQKPKAKRREIKISFWYLVWRLAGFPPVLVLTAFSYVTALKIVGDIGPSAAVITDDAVSYYRAWLWVVVIVNVLSFLLKVASWACVEAYAHNQTQCRQMLTEKTPAGQRITLETTALAVKETSIFAPPAAQPPPADKFTD